MNLHITKMSSNLEKVYQFASEAHASVNHLYDGKPYSYHLLGVGSTANKFIHLIPFEDQDVIHMACSGHDLFEDTRMTYNDFCVKLFDLLKDDQYYFDNPSKIKEVAEIIYALTNEKGRTRKERANYKYYQGIKNTKYAVFVKLCDRIANVQYSKAQGSRMFEMYKKEQPMFEMSLKDDNSVKLYNEMFEYLNNIIYGVQEERK